MKIISKQQKFIIACLRVTIVYISLVVTHSIRVQSKNRLSPLAYIAAFQQIYIVHGFYIWVYTPS